MIHSDSRQLPRRRGSAAVVTISSTDESDLSPVISSAKSLPSLTTSFSFEGRIKEEVEVDIASLSSTSTVVNPPGDVMPRIGFGQASVRRASLKDEKSSLNQEPQLSDHLHKHHSPKPLYHHHHLLRFITWFSPYRRLFVACTFLNALAISLTIGRVWVYPLNHLTTFVMANMLASLLARNEYALRLLYWIVIKLLAKSSPLRLRLTIVGLLYHIGGVHSGCGVSSVMWLVFALTRHILHHIHFHSAINIFLGITLSAASFTCLSAMPVVRHQFHNTFECFHRFAGWLGILSTSILIIMSAFWDSDQRKWIISAEELVRSEDFWMIVLVTWLSITPWLTVSRLPVEIIAPTNKITIIRFTGGLTSGLQTRISRGGLREWHIFGTISEGKQGSFHYVVAAVQGDFTRALNQERPSHLFTRNWKFCGLPYLARMFRRGVAVCTGSGIGAVGSTCIQNEDWFLVWIGANLEESYGEELMELIKTKIETQRRILWDTRSALGRPNVMDLLESVYHSWGAEMVLFIGSPSVNQEVLQSGRTRGIPVFGSIWDA